MKRFFVFLFLTVFLHIPSFSMAELTKKDLEEIRGIVKEEIAHVEKRINIFEKSVDKRFEQIDKRFEQIDKRLGFMQNLNPTQSLRIY